MADATPVNKMYLFRGNKYLKVDTSTMQIEGEPRALSDWGGLAGALNAGVAIDKIDAVVYLPTNATQYPGTVMFFKADKCCVFDPKTDTVTASGKITDILKNLPNGTPVDFTQDIDAAMIDPSTYLGLLKDGYETYGPVTTLDFGNTSRSVSAWTGLYPYQMGIQAATYLPTPSTWYMFRGDSWATYAGTQSQTIESLIPGAEAAGFGYDLDDVLVAPFDKKFPITIDSFPVPVGTVLTVTVLNNLAVQAIVTVAMAQGATDTLPAPATQETYKHYTVAGSGNLSISVTDDQNKPMTLSSVQQVVGGGAYRYIGAEKVVEGIYTDVVVLVTWSLKVT